MPVDRIFSYLVEPVDKDDDGAQRILGTVLPKRGRLVEMMTDIYDRSERDCDIEIIFRAPEGNQTNACRTLLMEHLARPTEATGRAIAARLQAVTTNRSGLGLLFLANGVEGTLKRLMLARFPADVGVVAEERAGTLNVDFVEHVFLKNAHAYKNATYLEEAPGQGFWKGKAVDKQSSEARGLSNYWIEGFLDSELETSARAGSKRLALALRQAINATPAGEARTDLLLAARMVRSLDGRRISPESLGPQLALSAGAVTALQAALPRPDLFTQTFELNLEEFDKWAAFRSVELDNGGVLIGPDASFDDVFHRQPVAVAIGENGPGGDRVRFITEGRVVKEQLRKSK
jgi:hypothetical protein